MDEIVDIVDRDCTVLYATTKGEAHKDGLLHRTVIARLCNSKGDWILVKQADDRQDAGQYVVPVGGHVQSGESDEDALRREALEETGLTDFTFNLVGKTIYERHVIGRHENHYFIIYSITTDEKLKLNHESVSYNTFSEDELKKALTETPEKLGAAFFALLEQFYPHLLAAKQ